MGDRSISRRRFFTGAAQGAALAAGGILANRAFASGVPGPVGQGSVVQDRENLGVREKQMVIEDQRLETPAHCSQGGAQRLSVKKLQAWENLGYGMFIHFGMGTYFGTEWWKGDPPASTYNPDKLNVDQWIETARDAGMKYAVLTAKHASGFCLWPTRYTDYNVTNSGNKTDVVKAFILACERRGVRPCLYYGSRDNHNGPPRGCKMPAPRGGDQGTYTTSSYQDFMAAQINELMTEYGPLMECWIDRPALLGQGYRTYIYNHIAGLQPDSVILLNHGWPSDILSYERALPPASGLMKWEEIGDKCYYMPAEVNIPIGKHWFYVEGDNPQSDQELLNLYQQT